MPVAGDDQIGLGGKRAGEHMIVVGIVGDDARHLDRHHHHRQAPNLADDAQRRQPRKKGSVPFLSAVIQ